MKLEYEDMIKLFEKLHRKLWRLWYRWDTKRLLKKSDKLHKETEELLKELNDN